MTRSQRKRKAKVGREDLRRLERLLYAESAGRMIAGRCAGCDRKIASYVALTPQEMLRRQHTMFCECGHANVFFLDPDPSKRWAETLQEAFSKHVEIEDGKPLP